MYSQVFKVKSKVWLYPGEAAWHFVTIPPLTTAEIDDRFSQFKRGFGSLPVTVRLGSSSWKTSIFPDKQTASYLLPIKVAVRKKESIKLGDKIAFELEVHE